MLGRQAAWAAARDRRQRRAANGVGAGAVCLVPDARAAVNGTYPVRILGSRLLLQDLGEEMMVAIPLASIIERDDEQVSSFQVFQDGLPAALACDGIAQRAAEAVEKRGLPAGSA